MSIPIVDTGDTELRYRAVSTTESPEIAEYPDSDKFAVLAQFPGDEPGKPAQFRYGGRERDSIGYWDGE